LAPAINDDILTKGIESWNEFKISLREKNRTLFHKMLNECKEYGGAVNSKGEPFSAESLFMCLILQQQKIINQLIDKISKNEKENEPQR
jgi:hypothetical protein